MTVQNAIDRCVRCGFCLPVCPTYAIRHDELSSPRGRIALAEAIVQGAMPATPATLATYSECLGCRACESACPSGVLFEDVLLYGREQLDRAGEAPPPAAGLLLWFLRSPLRLRLARRAWRRWSGVALRLARYLPPVVPAIGLTRGLPRPHPHEVRDDREADVVLHRGCLMEVLWEGTNARAVSLLQESGVRAARLPEDAGCCGALHAHAGQTDVARDRAKATIEAFERSDAAALFSLAGGCGAHLQRYPHLFEGDDSWHDRAVRFASAVRDITSLLADHGFVPRRSETTTTYQDSCHLRHGMGVWREPRAMLEQSSRYTELPSAARCCGSAGIYNLVHPDVAGEILAGKVDEATAIAPDLVVTANPGCEVQWRSGLHGSGLPTRVCHIVDYLYERRPDDDEH
jgi:glycolate oxidase iron-sulfur subunit